MSSKCGKIAKFQLFEIFMLLITFTLSPCKDIFHGRTISSAFSEHFGFGRLDELSVFYAVPPPLTFLLKKLHCSYLNCNRFHKHERLSMIMVKQVPKRWNITLNLFKNLPPLSTPWLIIFAIASLQNISWVFNFPNSTKIRENRENYYPRKLVALKELRNYNGKLFLCPPQK